MEKWQQLNCSPCEGKLSSQRVSELIAQIMSSWQQGFSARWITMNHLDDYYAMDISRISSYSDWIDFVRWGYNRDREALAQINLLMLTDVNSHMPLYYCMIFVSINYRTSDHDHDETCHGGSRLVQKLCVWCLEPVNNSFGILGYNQWLRKNSI